MDRVKVSFDKSWSMGGSSMTIKYSDPLISIDVVAGGDGSFCEKFGRVMGQGKLCLISLLWFSLD